MAPRRGRGARVIKVEQSVDYDNLTVKEVLCPICRSILIEPVTLPCSHVFCSSCFQGTMENANLVCPLCRMRIGSWLRSSKKENKLINVEYWNAIKRLFPQQIKNKLEGVEENLSYEDPMIQIAKPGELKKEYETLKQKETDSFKKEREAEMKASEALIKKLREEEEYQRIIEEEKLMMDEEIARKLAQELNTIENNEDSNPLQSNNNSKKNGPLDRFLVNTNMKGPAVQPCSLKQSEEKTIDYSKKDYTCRILCPDIGNDRVKTDMNRAIINKGPPTLSMLNHQISLELQQVLDWGDHSDSSDSIESECQYFKPIDYRKSIPCQRSTPIRVPAMKCEVKSMNISKPKGHCILKNDTLNSAFAAFGKLSIQDSGDKEKKCKLLKQTTKRLSLSSEKIKISPGKVKNINVSPDKKKLNSLYKDQSAECLSSSNAADQNENQTKGKVNSLVKRKLSGSSLDFGSPNKKNKMDSNNSFSRFLETPSSPFRGFSKTETKGNISQKRFTRNNSSGMNIDEKKIKLQVKSDYELAKKLQEHFDSSSYSTRSSAPRRGTKVTRQTTLDSLLSKKSKYQH